MGAVKNHYFDQISASPEPVFFRDEPVEGVFTVREGRIYRRDHHVPRDLAELLLPLFDEDPCLRHLAAELRAAMKETGALQ